MRSVDASKEAKVPDGEEDKSNPTEINSMNPALNMYYLRSFPKRERLLYFRV